MILIKKDGSFKYEKKTEDLYKSCKYSTNKQFVKLHDWGKYELWGKSKGKPGNENKCELPPPIETKLFYGTLCVIDKVGDVSLQEWMDWYNDKMGEVIDLEEEEKSIDSDLYSESEYTKEGYLKDSFIEDSLDEAL